MNTARPGSLLGGNGATACISRLTSGTDVITFANAAHRGCFLLYPSKDSCHPVAARRSGVQLENAVLLGKLLLTVRFLTQPRGTSGDLLETHGLYPRLREWESPGFPGRGGGGHWAIRFDKVSGFFF